MITSQDMQETEYTIQGIIEKLRVGYDPQKVILFGSYASLATRVPIVTWTCLSLRTRQNASLIEA